MNILEEAEKLTGGDRQKDYGHPAEDYARVAAMWTAILGTEVAPDKAALCMIAIKISRLCNSRKLDSLVDIAGYARVIELIWERIPELLEKKKAVMADAPTGEGAGPLVYISGPMSGCPNLNFPAFHAAAERLRSLGARVINPAESVQHSSWSWADYMLQDLAMITLRRPCLIATLEGWPKSKGAQLEVMFASGLEIPAVPLKDAERRIRQLIKQGGTK